MRRTFDCAGWACIPVYFRMVNVFLPCQASVPRLVQGGTTTVPLVVASATNFIGHVHKALIILCAASPSARRAYIPDGGV